MYRTGELVRWSQDGQLAYRGELTRAELDQVFAAVPGGADNVQDVQPLTPWQEGLLFHHLWSGEADPHVVSAQLELDSREIRSFQLV